MCYKQCAIWIMQPITIFGTLMFIFICFMYLYIYIYICLLCIVICMHSFHSAHLFIVFNSVICTKPF